MSLEGTWYNELGSKVFFLTNQGAVSGVYESAVGGGTGTQFLLAGRTDRDNEVAQNVGWAVSWESGVVNYHSVTSWSGQVQVNSGVEVLTAFWLLTTEVDPTANWKSTLVGKDVFHRNPPSDEIIARAKAIGPTPHPF